MNQEEIIEGNRIIALFMDGKFEEPIFEENGNYNFKLQKVTIPTFRGTSFYLNNPSVLEASYLEFHSNIEWIFKVFNKIENLENGKYKFTITPWDIQIIDYSTGNEEIRGEETRKNYNFIQCLFLTIVNFINWYNKCK